MGKENIIDRINGAVFLIFVGMVLLLNTTGVVPWGVWGTFIAIIIKFWPLMIINVGISIIFSKNYIIKGITSVLWTLFTIGIFVLAIFHNLGYVSLPRNITNWGFSLTEVAYTEKDQEIKFSDFKNIENLSYDFNIHAGDFKIDSNSKENNYLTLNAKYAEGSGEPEVVSEQLDSSLNIKFNQDNFVFITGIYNPEYNFDLNSNDLPTLVKVNLTAGKLDADLKDLTVDNLDVIMTAGDAKIELNEEIDESEIKVTAGSLRLLVPEDLKLNLIVSSTAGSIKVNGEEYKSGNYVVNENGSKSLKLTLNQTAGSIMVERY